MTFDQKKICQTTYGEMYVTIVPCTSKFSARCRWVVEFSFFAHFVPGTEPPFCNEFEISWVTHSRSGGVRE
jgi:hypothetical protein